MIPPKSVCYKCEKRASGCGATCKEFKAERAARHEEYERKYAENKVTSGQIELREEKMEEEKQMTEYVKKSEVLDTLWKADGITFNGIEVLNHMPAEDVIERPKNVEALLEIACDLCKYPSEYKDQDDLIHERCERCPMFEKLMEVAGD